MDFLGQNKSREQIIRQLYWDEELSQELVAQRLGCSPSMIYQLMKKFSIPTRTHSMATRVAIKHKRINFEEIRLKGYNTMRKEVNKGLRQWNRPGRHKAKITALEDRMGKPFKDILNSLYWDKQMSCRQITHALWDMLGPMSW